MEDVEESNGIDCPHFQILFFSTEKVLKNLPESVFNVPSSSGSDQFNKLLNKIAEEFEDDWNQTSFDFLIEKVLLRTSLLEFIETNCLSSESVIKVECVLREPAPNPEHDIKDSDWVSGLRITTNLILSVNYSGDLNLWNLKGEKLNGIKLDTDGLKCIDILEIDNELHAVVGGQNQSLSIIKIQSTNSMSFEPILVATLRGHQRSIECVEAKKDGTRIVSGSFDHCLKVWDTVKNDDDYSVVLTSNELKTKKQKLNIQTKVPMVTLESHREAIVGVKWNPLNECQVVTASWDHTLITWDLEMAGTLSRMTSNKAFSSLSINPFNGLVITGSTDLTVRMWDIRSKEGSFVKQTFIGHRGWVSDVKWSPDSENLFVSCSFDNLVKMWDVRSPKASLYDLIGHENRVLAVDWSNKELIASGGADCTIKTFRRTIK